MEPNASYINLPHARTIVGRLMYYLAQRPEVAAQEPVDLRDLLDAMERELAKYDSDPPEREAVATARRIGEAASVLTDEIVRSGYRGDRLGQCVRNLFECLGYPE